MTLKKKVLLMGKGSAGKTSMRSIIFSNFTAKDTRRLGATIDVEHATIRFLGNMFLNLWDCGGQDHFMDSYFTSQLPQIFRNVAVLIYVFDVSSSEREHDLSYYDQCIRALQRHSPDAAVYSLVHKMDLVPVMDRDARFLERQKELSARSAPLRVNVYGTSIFEDTLYRAWSDIIHGMVPDVRRLERHLETFRRACEAVEVVLFERTTFLVIATATATGASSGGKKRRKKVAASTTTAQDGIGVTEEGGGLNGPTAVAAPLTAPPAAAPLEEYKPMQKQRYEKISTIIKQFRHSCSQKMQTTFQSMEIHRPSFAAYMDTLTPNTFVMVMIADTSIQSAATRMNISMARSHFEKLEQEASVYTIASTTNASQHA